MFVVSRCPSNLRFKYPWRPPTFTSQDPRRIRPGSKPFRKPEPYEPPSSLDRSGKKPVRSKLPFDFQFSYTEGNQVDRPIALREPKHSPFGPDRLARVWTGVCAPAVKPKVGSVEEGKVDLNLEEKRRKTREKLQGDPLTKAERIALSERYQRHRSKRQINIGRDGLTHNMLNDIHNHWKHDKAVRIKCQGVSSVDMKNVCTQLEDKTFGKIIQRHGGLLILYRGRKYHSDHRPVIPLMLWKPPVPMYPKLIKTTIEGLSIEETKEMRKRGLAVPALTRLAKNGYYGRLVLMVRDAFLMEDLVRIDCKGLGRSDNTKIGCKLRDLVPCILVTIDKEQIVIWRGNDYKPRKGGIFLTEQELIDDHTDGDSAVNAEQHENTYNRPNQIEFYSGDEDDE